MLPSHAAASSTLQHQHKHRQHRFPAVHASLSIDHLHISSQSTIHPHIAKQSITATAMSDQQQNQQPTLPQFLLNRLDAFFVPTIEELQLLISSPDDFQKPVYRLLTPTWVDIRVTCARFFLPAPRLTRRAARRYFRRLHVARIRLTFGLKVFGVVVVLGSLVRKLVF